MPEAAGGHSVFKETRPQLGITVADAERLSDADKRRMGVVVYSGALIRNVPKGQPAGASRIAHRWCGQLKID